MFGFIWLGVNSSVNFWVTFFSYRSLLLLLFQDHKTFYVEEQRRPQQSSSDICCRNMQFETKLLNITHTWCSSLFARSLNKAIRQKPSITQYELWKNVYTLSRPAEKKLPSVESRCTIYSYFTFPKPTVESRALCFPLQGTNISY